MTPVDAARYLSLEVSTLKKRRRLGTGPKFYRFSSRCVRYLREDLDEWIDDHAVDPGEGIESGEETPGPNYLPEEDE